MINHFRCLAWVVLAVTLSVMETGIAQPLNVSVVLSEEGGVYQEFAEALENNLIKHDVALSIAKAGQPLFPEPDLIIAVGAKAATAVVDTSTQPVLTVFLSKETFEKLQRDPLKKTASISAIFLDQPIERQMSLINAALPNAHHVGIVYSHASPELRTLRAKATEHGLVVHEQQVNSNNPLPAALQEALKTSEVILALPDLDVYNASTIRNILLAAYRSRVPVVGFSASFVRAGAICGVFTPPPQLATQAASAVKQFAENHSLPAAQFAHEFEVQVNVQVGQSLGLNIPGAAEIKSAIRGDR